MRRGRAAGDADFGLGRVCTSPRYATITATTASLPLYHHSLVLHLPTAQTTHGDWWAIPYLLYCYANKPWHLHVAISQGGACPLSAPLTSNIETRTCSHMHPHLDLTSILHVPGWESSLFTELRSWDTHFEHITRPHSRWHTTYSPLLKL